MSEKLEGNQQIIELTYPKLIFTNLSIPPELEVSSPFSNALLRYLDLILFSPKGKFDQDCDSIRQFLKSNDLGGWVDQIGYYLRINKKQLTIEDFLKVGIYIDEVQISGSTILLSLPCSCTKSELLDTLDRIKQVVER